MTANAVPSGASGSMVIGRRLIASATVGIGKVARVWRLSIIKTAECNAIARHVVIDSKRLQALTAAMPGASRRLSGASAPLP
jgi:hypothetical protein